MRMYNSIWIRNEPVWSRFEHYRIMGWAGQNACNVWWSHHFILLNISMDVLEQTLYTDQRGLREIYKLCFVWPIVLHYWLHCIFPTSLFCTKFLTISDINRINITDNINYLIPSQIPKIWDQNVEDLRSFEGKYDRISGGITQNIYWRSFISKWINWAWIQRWFT